MTSRKIPESAVENLVSDLEGKANVANTVTTNTNQTITGQKVFTTGLLRNSTDIDVTSQPTSTTYNTLVRFKDKNGKELGAVNNAQMNGGNIRTVLEARNKDGYVPSIGVQAPYEGSTGGFGFAPNTPDNAPANAIVTADYVKNNYVDKTSTQTISGSKHFIQPAEGMSIELMADTNQQTVPAETKIRTLGLYRNTTYTKSDGYSSWVQGCRGSDGWTATELYARRFLESDSQEIINYLRVNITPDGIPVSYTRTPPTNAINEEIVTAVWFNTKMQVVSALPAAPDANVFYFIPG